MQDPAALERREPRESAEAHANEPERRGKLPGWITGAIEAMSSNHSLLSQLEHLARFLRDKSKEFLQARREKKQQRREQGGAQALEAISPRQPDSGIVDHAAGVSPQGQSTEVRSAIELTSAGNKLNPPRRSESAGLRRANSDSQLGKSREPLMQTKALKRRRSI
jgi:hypothetical protein